jgi:hypothetical protein
MPKDYKNRTYTAWQNMRKRCQPWHPRYERYGGRGITVCKRWEKYENFLADMGEAPPGLSLDRIHNDRGYSKRNCRWATAAVQQHNKRYITFQGITMPQSSWDRQLGISKSKTSTITRRLKLGWSLARALTEPLGKQGPHS